GRLDLESAVIRLAALVETREPAERTEAPSVTEVIRGWESATRSIARAEIAFMRYTYDTVAATEQRCDGMFYYEHPGRGVYEIRPAQIVDGEQSSRTGAGGKPFAINT